MTATGTTPTRCFRCKGKGFIRGRVDLLPAVFTFGITALIDKSETRRCPACLGRGYVR